MKKSVCKIILLLTTITGGWILFHIQNTSEISNTPIRSFKDSFDQETNLEESAVNSTSTPWRLSSGGIFFSTGRVGQTVQGDLPTTSHWLQVYQTSNPPDTDNGTHPQNIFRLETTSLWKNFIQEAYFRINKTNLSNSPNRNESNGLFFFNRAKNQDNLYYTGIRIDGSAVIKKKINGAYLTLREEKIINGRYDLLNIPNLLPQNTWIGMRSMVEDLTDGKVRIRLFVASPAAGEWQLAVEAIDETHPFLEAGYAGIRTDFMDVSFERYSISESLPHAEVRRLPSIN